MTVINNGEKKVKLPLLQEETTIKKFEKNEKSLKRNFEEAEASKEKVSKETYQGKYKNSQEISRNVSPQCQKRSLNPNISDEGVVESILDNCQPYTSGWYLTIEVKCVQKPNILFISHLSEHLSYFIPLLYMPYSETAEAVLFDSNHNHPCKLNLKILRYFECNILSNKFYNLLSPAVSNCNEDFNFTTNVSPHYPSTWLPIHFDIARKIEKALDLRILNFQVVGTYTDFLSMDSLPPLIQYFPTTFDSCEKQIHTMYLMFQLKKSITSNIKYFCVHIDYAHENVPFISFSSKM